MNNEVTEGRPLSRDQATTLASQIGAAATSGAPLGATLSALADDIDDKRLSRATRKLADRLNSGDTLEHSLQQMQSSLPRDVRAVMMAGASSGALALAFQRFAVRRVVDTELRRSARRAVAYAVTVGAVMIPVALMVSYLHTPMFRDILTEFDMDLPQMTKLAMNASDALPGLFAGCALFAVVIPAILIATRQRWALDRLRCALPVTGRLRTSLAQWEFASTLADFVELRIPLHESLAFAADSVADRNIARSARYLRWQVESGAPLSAAMQDSITFDRTLTALVTWGEGADELLHALRMGSDVFRRRLERQARLLRRLLPPVTIVLAGASVVAYAMSMLAPLVSLLENLI